MIGKLKIYINYSEGNDVKIYIILWMIRKK